MKIHFDGKEYLTQGFFLDTTEISNQAYLEFVKKTGVREPLSFRVNALKDQTKPASGMDWYDASLYCKLIGKRLPTYIELVRASQGEILRKYPFGNIISEFSKAPFQTLGYKPGSTFPVTEFRDLATPEGILNLAGNVREWTEEVQSEDNSDPIPTDTRRVYGGSYAASTRDVKVGAFQWLKMGSIIRDVGFRCARDVDNNYAISSSVAIDSDTLKTMVYGQQASKEDLLKMRVSKAVENIRKAQSESDQMKLLRLLHEQSVNLLRKRELAVSEQVELDDQDLVGIPYGLSWIGNPEPVMVYQDRFDIHKMLVTNNQFKSYLESSSVKPNLPPNHIMGDGLEPAKVTWHDARAYCKAINMDLPTEAQWEKTVRGPDKEGKLRFTPKGAPRGYYDIFQVVEGPSEWMLDAWNTNFPGSDKASLAINPLGKHSLLKSVRGRDDFPDSFATISSRRASLPFALHAFRCVRMVDEKPDFLINKEWNYLTPEFFAGTQAKIIAGEDVFNLNLKLETFENEP